MPLRRILVIAGLCLLGAACGESGTPASAAPETAEDGAAPAADCGVFGEDLIARWGKEKQLVLNLSLARGRNLKTMRETMGAPDPATFRTLADGFAAFDWSDVDPMQFQTPEEIVEGLRRTADLLEAALAAGGDTEDPAWTALSEFYTPQFFGKHNSAISYHLKESGCV